MDSRWPCPRKLIGRVLWRIGAIVLIGMTMSATTGAAEPVETRETNPVGLPELRAAKWIAPSDRFVGLSSQPRECLAAARTLVQARAVAIGRVAFRTPFLLGGAAARGGISCASCHSNGRRNAAFHLLGLSGAPGTADATSAIMSSHRDNGIFDPLPIPDLAAPGRISRADGDPALGLFVRRVIVDEFDGAAPAPAVMAGVLAYVRSLRPCTPEDRVPVTLATGLADIDLAVAAARAALQAGDADTARLMLAGARWTLGEIDERFAGESLARQRADVRRADRALGGLQQRLDVDPARTAATLAKWRIPPATASALHSGEPQSLYAPVMLAAALGMTDSQH